MSATMQQTAIDNRAREIDAELAASGAPVIDDADGWRELLGFGNTRAIHRAIQRGDLVAFKLGNRWRLRRAAVALFIARQEN